jgi:hypothetical protein
VRDERLGWTARRRPIRLCRACAEIDDGGISGQPHACGKRSIPAPPGVADSLIGVL